MSTALKISPKYYLEKEELRIVKSIKHSNNLHKLIKEYQNSEPLDTSEIEIKNERINSLRIKFLEEKFSLLDGGTEALVINSFDDALRLVFSSLAKKGDNVVSFNSKTLNASVLSDSGIEIKFSSGNQIENLKALIDSSTKAIYTETLNEDLSIPDFQKLSAIAKGNRIPLVVNNSSALAGFFSTPLKNGAHLVINNLASILNTFDSLTGAIVVEGDNFDWNNGNFKHLISKSRNQRFRLVNFLRDKYKVNYKDSVTTDGALDLINDLEKIQSESKNIAEITGLLANWLLKINSITSVIYPGIKSSHNYFNALKYFKNGFGNRIIFFIKGDSQDFEVLLYNLQRTRVILNNGKRSNYSFEYNKDKLSISLTITSGTFDEISEDFLYAFNELEKYKKLFSSRFLFQ